MSVSYNETKWGGAGTLPGRLEIPEGQDPDLSSCDEGGRPSLARSGPSGPTTTTQESYLQAESPSASPDDLSQGAHATSTILSDNFTFPVSMVPGDTPFVTPDIPENNYLKYWRISALQVPPDAQSSESEVTKSSLNDENILVKVHALQGCYDTIKPSQNGDLLVRVNSLTMSEKLQKLKMIGKTKVEVTPNNHLNFCKGVVSSSEFKGISDTDLQTMFSPIAVRVSRLTKKTKDGPIPSNSLLFLFKASVLPKSVKFGYLSFRVKPFLPNPMRCFNCQRYGHSNTRCHKPRRCGQCGSEDRNHPDSRSCTEDPQCPHCGESHPVWTRSCEALIREKELLKIMTTYKQSRREAKATWESQHPQDSFYSFNKQSYASKVSNPEPVSMPSTTPRGGHTPRGSGRGRGVSHPNRQSSNSSSINTTNRFSALSVSNQSEEEVRDPSPTPKKRTLSSESIDSSVKKPTKSKIDRSKRVRPLSSHLAQLIQDDTTYFHGHGSTFSNFNKHEPFVVHAPKKFIAESGLMRNNELVINCVEKLYQFRKAFYFNDIVQSQKIYKETTPGKMKVLGRAFDHAKDEWHEVAIDVMCECQFRKYRLPSLQTQLIKGTTNYVELTTFDNFWGTGSDFVGEGEGENWMGKILTFLRQYLQGKLADDHQFKIKFDNIKKQIASMNHEYFEIVKM